MALNPMNGASDSTVQNRFYGVNPNTSAAQPGNTQTMGYQAPGQNANASMAPKQPTQPPIGAGMPSQVVSAKLSPNGGAENFSNPRINMSNGSGGRNAEFGIGQMAGRAGSGLAEAGTVAEEAAV